MSRLAEVRNIEIFLAQVVFYLAIWLMNDYIGTLLTVIMIPILLGVLSISAMAEWIQPSKVSGRYFKILGLSILAPLIVAIAFGALVRFRYDWLMDLF